MTDWKRVEVAVSSVTKALDAQSFTVRLLKEQTHSEYFKHHMNFKMQIKNQKADFLSVSVFTVIVIVVVYNQLQLRADSNWKNNTAGQVLVTYSWICPHKDCCCHHQTFVKPPPSIVASVCVCVRARVCMCVVLLYVFFQILPKEPGSWVLCGISNHPCSRAKTTHIQRLHSPT